MGTTKDPYYEWLGIPPKDQPPNHYRLLGIELFERARKVIDTAANRQMTFVKQYQSGEDAELSQRILNELMGARLCLLNREKKAAYDETLRAQLGLAASSVPQPTRPTPPPVCSPTEPAASSEPSISSPAEHPAKCGALAVCSELMACPYCHQELSLPQSDPDAIRFQCPYCLGQFQVVSTTQDSISAAATGSNESSARRSKRTSRGKAWGLRVTRLLAIAGGATPVLVILFVALSTLDPPSEWTGSVRFASIPRDHESVPSTPSGSPCPLPNDRESDRVPERVSKISGSKITETGSEEGKPVSTSVPTVPRVIRRELASGRPIGDVAAASVESALMAPESRKSKDDSEVRGGLSSTVVSVTHEEDAVVPTVAYVATAGQRTPHRSRIPVPDDQSLHHALDRVKDLFQAEYAGALGGTGKKQLAGRLLREADSIQDDADARYAILRAALDLYLEAENVPGTMAVVDRIASDFDINPLLAKGRLLRRMSGSASGRVRQLVGKRAFTMSEEALQAEQPELAVAFLDMAGNVAKSTHDRELAVLIRERDADLRQLAAVMAAVETAKETLEHKEDDPDACLTVGEWLCFRAGDWERGLTLLAKGSNPQLKMAAELETTARSDVAQRKQLADLWLELADSAEDRTVSLALKRRAKHWYTVALPEMTGLDRIAVERVLAQLRSITERDKAPATPRKDAKPPE
jgi:hypothetical protein